MQTSEKVDQIIPALFQAKQKFASPKKDAKNPAMHNEYSSLTANLDAIEPALAQEGLLVMQHPRLISLEREGTIAYQLSVLTRVWHVKSGQWVEIEVQTLPTGRKQRMPDGSVVTMPVSDQELGSSITYNRRYSLRALFSLADRDDDGNGNIDSRDTVLSREVITEEQVGVIDQLMADTGADYAKFCKYYGVQALTELPASYFEAAVSTLKRKTITQDQVKELSEKLEKDGVDPSEFCANHNIDIYKDLPAYKYKLIMSK